MEEEDGIIGSLVYSESEGSDEDNSALPITTNEGASEMQVATVTANASESEDSDVAVGKAKKAAKNIISSDEGAGAKEENGGPVAAGSSHSEESGEEKAEAPKRKKILKQRKELNKRILHRSDDSSSGDESENENATKTALNELCDSDTSVTSQSENEPGTTKPPPKREKTEQRVRTCPEYGPRFYALHFV